MISRFRKNSQIIQQETEIIQEMLAFFQENEYQPSNKMMQDKLHEYFFRIFELEVKEMGGEPYLSDDRTIDDENKNRIYLIFESNHRANDPNRLALGSC